MRTLVVGLVGAALLLPIGASGGVAECRRLTRQIEHFEGMVDRAQERDSELWEERTQAHVERHKERQEARCPQENADDSGAAQFAQLLKLAGKAALTYFTLGAF